MNGIASKKVFYFLNRVECDDDKYRIIPLKCDEVVIGRGLDSTFKIADLSISRTHAIFKKGSHSNWTITNMSSSGVLVNGVALPHGQEQPLHLNNTIQFCANTKYIYKFGCKAINVKRKRNNDDSSKPITSDTGDEAPVSAPEDGATQQLEHDKVVAQLQFTERQCEALTAEKLELTESMDRQQQQLMGRYQVECEQLQQQVLDGQWHNETKERLATQLQQQVDALQSRLQHERQQLEQKLQQEEQHKQQLQHEQEALKQQLQEEKQALQAELEKERDQHLVQVAEKVHEAELQMQQQLQQVQEQLQQEQSIASSLSKELELKKATEERLQALEDDKAALEKQLEEAQQEGDQASQLQAAVQRMEQEKMTLQQEMEMMEFAVTAEAKKTVVDTVEQVMDSEMQCPICNELFIKATLLNCSHTFCQFCIDCWKKNKRDCPACRTPIRSETRSLAIDNFIEKIVETLSEDMKKKRKDTIKEREQTVAAATAATLAAAAAREAARGNRGRGRRASGRGNRGFAQRRGGTRGGAPVRGGGPSTSTAPPTAARGSGRAAAQPGVSFQPIISLSSSSSDSDNSDDSNRSRSDGDSSSSLSGDEEAYFGGYGRCFNCGRRGHWANGCPEL